MHKPQTVDEFRAWSSEATCGVLGDTLGSWYANTQNNCVSCLNQSDFFSGLGQQLESISQKYSREMGGASLFGIAPSIKWYRKPFDSFVEKLFRLNIKENDNYPSPPKGGWLTPVSSLKLGGVDDIVRTSLVVTYADAPAYLALELVESARRLGSNGAKVKDHSKEKGYYAHHVYCTVSVDVATLSGVERFSTTNIPIEIQISTQLQAVLYEITHRLYELERLHGIPDGWKEDFESHRFRAAYMAHSLRFIEAMVVDLRNMTGQEGQK